MLLQTICQPQMLATLHVCLAAHVEAQHVYCASTQQHVQTAVRHEAPSASNSSEMMQQTETGSQFCLAMKEWLSCFLGASAAGGARGSLICLVMPRVPSVLAPSCPCSAPTSRRTHQSDGTLVTPIALTPHTACELLCVYVNYSLLPSRLASTATTVITGAHGH